MHLTSEAAFTLSLISLEIPVISPTAEELLLQVVDHRRRHRGRPRLATTPIPAVPTRTATTGTGTALVDIARGRFGHLGSAFVYRTGPCARPGVGGLVVPHGLDPVPCTRTRTCARTCASTRSGRTVRLAREGRICHPS
jgi:hypothetical protein